MQNRSNTGAMRVWTRALLPLGFALVACNGADSSGDSSNVDGNGGQGDGGSTAAGGTAMTSGGSSSRAGAISGSGGEPNVGGNGGQGDGGSTATGGAPSGAGATNTLNRRSRCKRGVAYGHHSDADMTVLSPRVVWWYNWHYVPDSSLSSGIGEQLSVEYVPMVWGPGVNLSDVETRIPASATTLLGYNEPNFYDQANASASDTARNWPKIQAIADKGGLRLVSAAVNYCGGGCHDTDPFSFLKAFFQACPACRVDAIAVHVYVGCQITGGNHAQWLIDHLERYQTEFSQPIWLTEFACNDARNVAEQKAFLEDAVTYLEATPRIERYAWFAGRADNVPYVDLLEASGKLTELGQAYLGASANADCQP